MKIGYIILAHKNIPQVRWLLEAVQGEGISIFLHLDKLAGNDIFTEAQETLKDIHGLSFLKRTATSWGGFGLVGAALAGIRDALVDGCDYLVLLSGQDYPVKTQEELKGFLEDNLGHSFMEYYAFPHPLWKDQGGYDRIRKWHISLPFKQTRLIKRIRAYINQSLNLVLPERSFPPGLTPYGGSQWWCLYKDCAEYMLQFSSANKKTIRYFKTVRIPDEIFFQTVLMNSPLAGNITNQKLTYVDWDGPPFPRILDGKDIERLACSEYFFARKFDLDVSSF